VIPALLLPTILVRHWSPYFACLPAVGVAMILGAALGRLPTAIAVTAVVGFVMLGSWCRGVSTDREWILSERRMVEAAEAVQTLKANFRQLIPHVPKGSQVVASVGARGLRGIQAALFEGQALSLWYGDPTLRTVRPMKRQPAPPSEYLVRVTDGLDVIVIDADLMEIRTTAGRRPGPIDTDPLLLSYARAVAAAGETDRAIRIVEALNLRETGELIADNRRIVASMLLAAGRRSEADSILAVTESFTGDVARALVLRLLSEASPSEKLDEAAFEAFGLSASEPETVRWIVRRLKANGSVGQAAWFAQKLARLAPGDPEAASVLALASAHGIGPTREPTMRLPAHR
jgi:hypothetical protein